MSDNEEFNLFAKLSELPRPSITVEFPGAPEIQVKLVTLNNYELMTIKAAAQKKVNEMMKGNLPTGGQYSPGYISLYDDALAVETLFTSCKNPDTSARFFPTRESLSNNLTNEQIGILVNHYNELVVKYGPIVSEMTNEEMDDLINKIKAAGSNGSFFLNSLTLEGLKEFATYTANLC